MTATSRRTVVGLVLSLLATAMFASRPPAASAGNVTTAAYGNLRDDWDGEEPALSPSEVHSKSFERLFMAKLEGQIYAQPLAYNGTIVVTTEKAKAYGINATTGAIEWSRSFGTPFRSSTIGCSDLTPFIGSTSTPVIDSATGTIYVTTRLEQTGVKGGLYANSHWWLQAISAATGEERPGFPVEISGTPYNTPGIPFNEHQQQQRPALLLLGGVVYMAFASDCDFDPYRGVVVGVNETSGAVTTMWSDESGAGAGENSMAGIWQSGAGLVSNEPGHILLTTGNGVSPSPAASNKPPPTLSESVVGLKVEASGQITPTQFFAPSNAPTLDAGDTDLGSGGPIVLPSEYFGTKAHPQLVVQIGKDGRMFLLDAAKLGGYRQGPGESDAVLQTLDLPAGVWGHPAAYGGQGGWVYVLESAGGGYLQALSYGLGAHGEPQLAVAGTSSESFGYTSGSPLVTSNGTQAASAVVWVVYTRENGGELGAGGQLRAYGATPEAGTLPLLWSAPIGHASKFATPTSYDGRVYVGDREGHLFAFGPSSDAPVQAAPVSFGSVEVGQSESADVEVSASQDVELTAPVTASGEEAAPASAGESATAAPTAGPSRIPPSGNVSLSHGVFTIQQPPVGTAIPAGAHLHLRLTFHPRHRGPVVAVLTLHTRDGERTITVTGYGSAPGLLVSAPPLAFHTVATGAGGRYMSFTVANSWTRAERITGVRLPRGPYTATGLPTAGEVLQPRQAVTVSLHFDPARPGSYDSRLAILTDHGAAVIPVTGLARTGSARLSLSTRTLDFGDVRVGRSRTLRFSLSDGGNIPLTIERAIAPVEPFLAPLPVPEGISLEAGTRLGQSVTFTPTARGSFSGRYIFNGNGGQGYVTVRLLGRGV